MGKSKKSSLNLIIAAAFIVVLGAVLFWNDLNRSGKEVASPPKSLPKPEVSSVPAAKVEEIPGGQIPQPGPGTKEVKVETGLARTDVGIGGIPAQGSKNAPPPPMPEVNSPPEAELLENQKSVDELKAEMEEQMRKPPPELPEDLQRQLAAPPPELPEDLKAQINATPPEVPEDIKRALSIPPRIVTLDEVNTPPAGSPGASGPTGAGG